MSGLQFITQKLHKAIDLDHDHQIIARAQALIHQINAAVCPQCLIYVFQEGTQDLTCSCRPENSQMIVHPLPLKHTRG